MLAAACCWPPAGVGPGPGTGPAPAEAWSAGPGASLDPGPLYYGSELLWFPIPAGRRPVRSAAGRPGPRLSPGRVTAAGVGIMNPGW